MRQPIPGEDAIKTVEMTTKDLEYYINLVDKAAVGFESTDSYFERSSTVGKMLSKALCATEKLVTKGGVNQCGKLSLLSYFKKLPQPFNLQQSPP